MFDEPARTALLEQLIAAAQDDDRVVAAALVGSLARAEQDRWSDLDLALRLAPGLDAAGVAAGWTPLVARLAPIVDTLDVRAGAALYRVFLLDDSMQLDLSFWPHDAFRSNGEPFRLLFGEALAAAPVAPPDPREALGWGWLHGLHARAAIARGRAWQALQMVQGLRDQLIVLACLRAGLPSHQGRGVDRLPTAVRQGLLETVPADLSAAEHTRVLEEALRQLAEEAELLDPQLAGRLTPVLRELARPS